MLTVGAIHAGTDNNVIASSTLLKINLRWFNDINRHIILDNIDRINKSIASTYNLLEKMYPTTVMKGNSTPLINDEKMTERITTALKDFLPEEQFFKGFSLLMGSEDFHHLVIDNPKKTYAYINVRIINPETFKKAKSEGKQFPFFPHNGDYLVDIEAIPIGTKIGAVALMELLGN